MGVYRKMHIPDDPLYYEKFYFTPGDTGFRAWKTKYATIGVLICWDQWYPEGARLTALQGAEILFYPTAIGWHPREKQALRRRAARKLGTDSAQPRRRQRLFRRRAQSHRTGENPQRRRRLRQRGRHPVLGPIVCCLAGWAGHDARLRRSRKTCSWPSATWSEVEFSRTHWPFLRDRRIDAYGDLCRRYVDSK